MGNVTVKLNGKGIQALLKSPGVQADLERRAKAVAAAGGPGMEATTRVGKQRARASVVTATPEARKNEAVHRSLSGAVDAARK